MKTQPKVAYLTSLYPAVSQTFIFREIQYLRSQGFTVIPFSVQKTPEAHLMTPPEQKEARETTSLKTWNLLKYAKAHLKCFFRKPVGYLRVLWRGLTLIRRQPQLFPKILGYLLESGLLMDSLLQKKLTHIHVHFANPSATVALLSEAYGSFDYSLSVHGPDIFDNQECNFLREKFQHALFIRCISDYCKSQVQRLLPPQDWHRCHLVRCGVDPEAYQVRLDPQSSTPQILCVGRLVAAKGYPVLLQACQELVKEGVSFHLTIVGGGPEWEALMQLSQDWGLESYVTFTGPLGQDEVKKHYDLADLFVLPSFAEGVPVVLMEAMAKGIPSISTRITGIPELIHDGEDGFLAPPANVVKLKERMHELLCQPELRSKLGSQARKKIVDHYHLHHNTQSLVELFKTYLTQASP